MSKNDDDNNQFGRAHISVISRPDPNTDTSAPREFYGTEKLVAHFMRFDIPAD